MLLPSGFLLAVAWGLSFLGLPAGWSLVSVLTLLGTIGLVAGGIASPLAFAAVAVDDADTFDAASRSLAYATQRVARLACYVGLAAAIGIAAGVLLEFVLALHEALLGALFTRPTSGFVGLWDHVSRMLLRGFYPAYWVSATTAIYLLLRRDIDGQPIDEMGSPAAVQPSSDA